MRNALLRGEALTTLAAAAVLALAPAVNPGVGAQRVSFYAMAAALTVIAVGIVAFDRALRLRPVFSEKALNELANPWQHPLGVEPRKSREQASASRPPMDRAGSDPAPAAR